jgi:hypothetical protein
MLARREPLQGHRRAAESTQKSPRHSGFLPIKSNIGSIIADDQTHDHMKCGELFDSIGKTAPFAMMACFNLVIVTWAVYVYLTQD